MEATTAATARKSALKSAQKATSSSEAKPEKRVTFHETSSESVPQAVYPKKVSQQLHNMVRWSNAKLGMVRKNTANNKSLLLKLTSMNQELYAQCHERIELSEEIKARDQREQLSKFGRVVEAKKHYDELIQKSVAPAPSGRSWQKKSVNFTQREMEADGDGSDHKHDITSDDFDSSDEGEKKDEQGKEDVQIIE